MKIIITILLFTINSNALIKDKLGGSDNLGNHTATTTLDMANNDIIQFSILTGNNFELNTIDAYQRPRLWYYAPNSVLKLGASTSDGDEIDADSEGIIVINSSNQKMSRIEADRIGLTSSQDSSLYYFRVDENSLSYKRSIDLSPILHINNASGDVGIGTDNPVSQLDVNGTITTNVLNFTGNGYIYNTKMISREYISEGNVYYNQITFDDNLEIRHYFYTNQNDNRIIVDNNGIRFNLDNSDLFKVQPDYTEINNNLKVGSGSFIQVYKCVGGNDDGLLVFNENRCQDGNRILTKLLLGE